MLSTLSTDQQEVKLKFWEDNYAQKFLRSLIRLWKGHQVNCSDIMDDLHEVEQHPLSKTAVSALLGQFCEKSLISDQSKKRYNVPPFDELAPFLNPEMGDVPDDDDDGGEDDDDNTDGGDKDDNFSQSSEDENESSPWSSDESSFLRSKESPIILESDDDTDLFSVLMTIDEPFTNLRNIPEAIGSDPLGRKSPRKITPTKILPQPPYVQTNPTTSSNEEQARMISYKRVSSDHANRPKTKTFIDQPEKKQRMCHNSNTGDTISKSSCASLMRSRKPSGKQKGSPMQPNNKVEFVDLT
jgi:hypothetical protein